MRQTILTTAILIAALLLGAQGRTLAQQLPQIPSEQRLFDEYGNLRACDHSARLDNYSIQLQNEPGMT